MSHFHPDGKTLLFHLGKPAFAPKLDKEYDWQGAQADEDGMGGEEEEDVLNPRDVLAGTENGR